jgi:copper(I)-binding protein
MKLLLIFAIALTGAAAAAPVQITPLMGASATAADASLGDISISKAASRAAIAGGNGAAYAEIANAGDTPDRLIGVKGDIANAIEIHEMSMDGGVMQMRKIDGLDIPAHGSAELKPGGYHVMLIGLTRALNAGDTISLTFVFEHAGEITVAVPVGKAGEAPHAH